MERKLLSILCILSIFTFTTSLFSSLLIYLNDNNHTRVNSSSIINKKTKYKKSLIVYENSNHVDIRNIDISYQGNYSIILYNDNSDVIDYKIKWSNVNNDWNSSDFQNLLYDVKCDDGLVLENQAMPYPNEDKDIVSSILVHSNKAVTCGINIKYNSNYLEQTNNLFIADLEVVVNS